MTTGLPVTPPPALSRRRVLVIIGALMLGMILASLDQTVVATVDRPRDILQGLIPGKMQVHGSMEFAGLQTHQDALTGRRRA